MDNKEHLAQVNQDRLHRIAETLNAFVIRENGSLLFVSQTLADLLGYRGEELLAKDGIELMFAPQSRPTTRQMVASGSSNAYEALMVRSDDSFLPVEIINVNIRQKSALGHCARHYRSLLSARGLPRLAGWLRNRKGTRSKQGRAHSRRRARGYGRPIRGG